MYSLYLLSFRLLHAIGMKKTSVRLARALEKYCRHPLDNSKLYDAIWEFVLNVQKYDFCDDGRGNGCYMPVLSDNDKFHEYCRGKFAEEDALMAAEAAEQAEADAYLASRCKQLGCWEEAVKEGYCLSDWAYNFMCGNCGKLLSDCAGSCLDSEEVNANYAEAYDADGSDDRDDDYVSTSEVYGRAYAHFGNAEMAREATEMYPGDFM